MKFLKVPRFLTQQTSGQKAESDALSVRSNNSTKTLPCSPQKADDETSFMSSELVPTVDAAENLYVSNNSSILVSCDAPPISGLAPGANSRIKAAHERLHRATRELAEAFDAYSTKFSDTPCFDNQSIRTMLSSASSTTSFSGDDFGRAVETLVSTQLAQRAGFASRVGGYMSKIFPLANLALGLLSTAAGVCRGSKACSTLSDLRVGRGNLAYEMGHHRIVPPTVGKINIEK